MAELDYVECITKGKILNVEKAIQTAQILHEKEKQIVLVGGCFDILHHGHSTFLKEAKKQGDILMVLLESDETVRKQKGRKRPCNNQQKRAQVLASLPFIDYIISLPALENNHDYDRLVIQIKPAIIATTKGDPGRHHKERQAKTIDANVVDVIDRLDNISTTRLTDQIR